MLGSRTEITYDDATKFKYVSCVFKESLRLYPPATEVTRFVTEEITANSYRIPKDTPVMVNFLFSIISLTFLHDFLNKMSVK